MNDTLKTFLPEHMFCAATLMHLFERGDIAHIWTGGLPDGYIVRPDKGIVQTIKSKNMPLGILNSNSFNSEPSLYRFEALDKLVLISDGILEAVNPDSGDMFGEHRLQDTINTHKQGLFDGIVDTYQAYIGEQDQSDDISLIEISAEPYESKSIRELSGSKEQAKDLLPWRLSLDIYPHNIREMDVVNHAVSLLPSKIRISQSFDNLRTILSELFSNALEHGLLNLSSAMKQGHDGFVRYYEERQKRLASLNKGVISLAISTLITDDQLKVKIKLEDSGHGFDIHESKYHGADVNQPWGRGIDLVRSLSETLNYSNNGKVVEAVMVLS